MVNNFVFKDQRKKEILDSLVRVKYEFPTLGKTVPELPLTDLSGRKVSLADFKGKNVIINFWAVWCGPCREEFPFENQLSNENRDEALTVINIFGNKPMESSV